MCRRQMRRLSRLDWFNHFEQMEYDEAVHYFPEVARGTLGDGMRVRFPNSTATVGIDAVRSIGMRLPVTAPLAWLLYVPGFRHIGDRVYRFVAARRRTTATDSCALPLRD
jgi:hypothetical protein